MASLNKVMLIGRLGKDPEVRFTGSGSAVASFSVATTERTKNKSGEWEDKTEWHNVVIWGRLAEIAGEYLRKGSLAYFEGRMSTRKWVEKNDVTKYTTEVIADKMQMLTPKAGGEAADNDATRDEKPPINPDDDIPF